MSPVEGTVEEGKLLTVIFGIETLLTVPDIIKSQLPEPVPPLLPDEPPGKKLEKSILISMTPPLIVMPVEDVPEIRMTMSSNTPSIPFPSALKIVLKISNAFSTELFVKWLATEALTSALAFLRLSVVMLEF